MTLPLFTLIHVMISLVGIAAGFGVMSGLMAGKLFSRWTAIFLITTIATSVTGFFFPFNGVTPGIVIGVLSLLALGPACYALYGRRLAGVWRKVFIFTAVISQYFNVFVLIVQLFQKMPVLKELAPNQNEPPFAITQGLLLVTFIAMGVVSLRKFREETGRVS